MTGGLRKKLLDEGGLSLVEAVVSAAIFTVIAGGVSSLVRTAFVTAGLNVARNHAIAIAEDRLEELRSLDYDDLEDLAPVASVLPTQGVRQGVTFGITTLLQPDVPDENMTQIKVTVTWDHRGLQRTHDVSTIYTEVFGGG